MINYFKNKRLAKEAKAALERQEMDEFYAAKRARREAAEAKERAYWQEMRARDEKSLKGLRELKLAIEDYKTAKMVLNSLGGQK